MKDLISRKDVLKFIGSMNMCDQIDNSAYKELITHIDNLPAEPQWISVEDELPKRGQVVLVASEDRKTWDVGQYQGIAGWSGDKRMWNWKKKTVRRVDYWMPKDAIPIPRKGAEHETD